MNTTPLRGRRRGGLPGRLPACVAGSLVLMAGVVAADLTSVATDVVELLPEGEAVVDVMTLTTPARLQVLAGKLQQAAVQHQAWWLDHIKHATPGEPFPYDPKLGLTAEEYREFLLLQDQLTMRKVGEAHVRVIHAGASRYAFEGAEALPDLTGIVIDLERLVVETPFGTCAEMSAIHASPHQQATDPWDGYQWKLETGDLQAWERLSEVPDVTVVTFDIGRLRESGRGIISYSAKQVRSGALSKADVVVTYAPRGG